jgi:hypothetical protein
MTRVWPVALLTMVALVAGPTRQAFGCFCAPGSPCQATWRAEAIFAGTVRSIESVDTITADGPIQSDLVTFDVERGFLNAKLGTIELVNESSTCGYRFQKGRRYLVYAEKAEETPSRLAATVCSRTRPLEEAAEDIAYLSAIGQLAASGRVNGRVTRSHRDPFEEHRVDYGPVEGLVVNLRGDTFSRDATTDRDGRYEFTGVPPGKLLATLLVPPGFDARYLERELDLTDPRACRINDYQIHTSARASGTVVDEAGRPEAGVWVDAVAEELAGYQPPPYQSPVKTDEQGRFTFDDLPPGAYVFGVNLTKRPGAAPPGRPTFFPGTGLVKEATPIDLKPGDRVDVGRLRLSGARF